MKNGTLVAMDALDELGKDHTLVIVGCGKTKRSSRSQARNLYTGQLFQAARRWAEQHGDRWLIASARHGLVQPDAMLEPYERTLRGLGRDRIRQFGFWCQAGLAEYLKNHGRPGQVIILAGQDYVKPLLQFTTLRGVRYDVRVPMEGLGIGHRMQWLKQRTD